MIDLGVHTLAGLTAAAVRELAAGGPDGLLVLTGVRPSDLTPLLRHQGVPGFVVVDLPDVDEFAPIELVAVPGGSAYVLGGLDRGDAMLGWTPDEALPAIVRAGRTPLTVAEGLYWLLQQPEVLVRGRCFMTVGSRLRKKDGSLDARTPAIWISNGTGRDGSDRRNAPKVGWCWAGNRHTWLGFASASSRQGLPG